MRWEIDFLHIAQLRKYCIFSFQVKASLLEIPDKRVAEAGRHVSKGENLT